MTAVSGTVRADGTRKPTRMLHAVVVAAAAAALATACSTPVTEPVGAEATGDASVIVDAVSFAPADLVIDEGTTVTWVWAGGVPHDVSGDGFTSPIQDEGRFQHTFDEFGVYPYRCNLHSEMRGTVTVARS